MKKLFIIIAVLLSITSCDYFFESDAISIPSWAVGKYRVYTESYGKYPPGDYILEITSNNLVYEGTNGRGDYDYFNLADYMSDPDIFIKDQSTASSWYDEYILRIYDYSHGYEHVSYISVNKYPESSDMGYLFVNIDEIDGHEINIKFIRM